MLVHSNSDFDNPRIEALRQKHQQLSCELENELKKPSFSDFHINNIKKQKLILKEEISKLQDQEKQAVNG